MGAPPLTRPTASSAGPCRGWWAAGRSASTGRAPPVAAVEEKRVRTLALHAGGVPRAARAALLTQYFKYRRDPPTGRTPQPQHAVAGSSHLGGVPC